MLSANELRPDGCCRKDGVCIAHNLSSPGMAEHCGLPGQTDSKGFDPCADPVSTGTHSGSVKCDNNGHVLICQQTPKSQSSPRPDGKGCSLMAKAIQMGPEKVQEIPEDHPQLKNDIGAGCTHHLHTCGMSQKGQLATQVLIDLGADICEQDAWGCMPLHQTTSNDLAIRGEALVEASQDLNGALPGQTALPLKSPNS